MSAFEKEPTLNGNVVSFHLGQLVKIRADRIRGVQKGKRSYVASTDERQFSETVHEDALGMYLGRVPRPKTWVTNAKHEKPDSKTVLVHKCLFNDKVVYIERNFLKRAKFPL